MDLSNSNKAQPAKQIFILSGQSNMSGRGGVAKNQPWNGVVPPESSADGERIFRLNAELRWEVAHEPLHQGVDSNRIFGVGPGLAFANAVKDTVGVVGLVLCAAAGTQIKDWARGTAMYDNMVKRAEAAAVHGGEIKAVLWYQGEKDTFKKEDVDLYKENVYELILNVRYELILNVRQDLHLVGLASGREYLEKVRDVQKGIDLPNVVYVDAKVYLFKKTIFISLQKPMFNWALCWQMPI